MTGTVNTAQEQVWNGEEGRRWTEHHRRLDRMAEPANGHLFAGAAIAGSDHVLDIGCGTGHTTRIAARHARSGQAVGIDLSAPMLELARRIAAEESLANITFERGDAQVHPLPSGRFDVAISRAGIMFFDDPVAAFANVRRSLRRKGRLAFLCHRDGGDQMRGVFAALARHVPSLDLDGHRKGVADFTDAGHIRQVLDHAGFTGIATSPVEYLTVLGHDAMDAAGFLLDVQLAGFVADAEGAALAGARDALASALRPYERDGAVRLPASAWIVTAHSG